MEKAEKERKIVGLSSSDGEGSRRQPLKIVLFWTSISSQYSDGRRELKNDG
jgi:hypothetical protein